MCTFQVFPAFCFSVVDVYSAWCGPCKAVISLFRRVKNELGDNLLRFAVVSIVLVCMYMYVYMYVYVHVRVLSY